MSESTPSFIAAKTIEKVRVESVLTTFCDAAENELYQYVTHFSYMDGPYDDWYVLAHMNYPTKFGFGNREGVVAGTKLTAPATIGSIQRDFQDLIYEVIQYELGVVLPVLDGA